MRGGVGGKRRKREDSPGQGRTAPLSLAGMIIAGTGGGGGRGGETMFVVRENLMLN